MVLMTVKFHVLRLTLCLLWLSCLLTGCADLPGSFASRITSNGRLLSDGPVARMTERDVVATRSDEVPLLYYFAIEAGENLPFPQADLISQQIALKDVKNWGRVTQVGEGYIDIQCQRFIAKLDELERAKRATLSGLNVLQSTAVGIMGLAQAAQKAIGIVGVSFGLTTSLFDITTSTVLYQLPAASVASVVQAQRGVLRTDEAAILVNIDNQGAASARLGEYILHCSPVTIEINIGKLLSTARTVSGTDIGSGVIPAAVTSANVQGTGLSNTAGSVALRAFLDAPGLSDADRVARLRAIRDAAQKEGSEMSSSRLSFVTIVQRAGMPQRGSHAA